MDNLSRVKQNLEWLRFKYESHGDDAISLNSQVSHGPSKILFIDKGDCISIEFPVTQLREATKCEKMQAALGANRERHTTIYLNNENVLVMKMEIEPNLNEEQFQIKFNAYIKTLVVVLIGFGVRIYLRELDM